MKYIAGIIFSIIGIIGSGFMIFIGYIAQGMPHSPDAVRQGYLLMGVFTFTGIFCIGLIFWLYFRRKAAKKSTD